MLKRELSSVQKMMDQLTISKENERDALQKNLEELQNEHEMLKNELNEVIILKIYQYHGFIIKNHLTVVRCASQK